jgi:hypothetical protein
MSNERSQVGMKGKVKLVKVVVLLSERKKGRTIASVCVWRSGIETIGREAGGCMRI